MPVRSGGAEPKAFNSRTHPSDGTLAGTTVVVTAAGREAEALATLVSLNVAGIIAIPLGHASTKSPYKEAVRTVPLVFVDCRAEADAAFVGTDNRQSIGLMVDYLLRSGSPPSYFDMPDVNENARERRRAFGEAMRKHGADVQVHSIEAETWDFERAAFERALKLFKEIDTAGTTILCANDRIAFGVMAAASQAGLQVGRMAGLRVAGHDDHPLSRYACPSLTTVAQDGDELASVSLQALLRQVAGDADAPSQHLVEAKLMMRDSA